MVRFQDNASPSGTQHTSGLCGLTVLRTLPGASATKQWTWNPHLNQWRKSDYQAGVRFIPTEHSVASLAELVAVLDAVRREPRAFVVRGALTPDTRAAVAADPLHQIRRRKHLKGNVQPTLAEVPRRWVMLDIDNWPLRPSDDLASDPLSAIDHAIHELLPVEFHDAQCWWQLSSSAGFVPGTLKAHLFFWLAEPADNLHIKAVLKQHAPGIDRAPFSAAQPHYIADPVIEGGIDPLPVRTGWRRGLDKAVTLPALAPAQTAPRGAGMAIGRAGGVLDALAVLGDGEGLEGFHGPLLTATMRYARRCARYGDRDDVAFRASLRDAIRAAPKGAGRDVESVYCQDSHLDPLIRGAFALLAGDADAPVMLPHHAAAAAMSLEDARAATLQHARSFLGRALAWHALDDDAKAAAPAEHAALAVGVGVGKSTAARQALPEFIETAKAAGQPHRVLWLVPTHVLGNEALAAMRKLSINAAVMRGRDADVPNTADPENYVPAQKMCLNLDAVEDAIAALAQVESDVCGKPGFGCPWRTECEYQRQKAVVAQADVVIAAHQSLFHDLPKEAGGGLAVVIVDEAWWQAGLNPHRELHLASIAQEPVTHPVLTDYKPDEFATADLHGISLKAQRAFEATPDGAFVSKAALLAAGLTDQDCTKAHRLEWQRKVKGTIHPGQTANERREQKHRAAGNAAIPRRGTMWKVLQGLLKGEDSHTGRLQMSTKTTAEGTTRVVVLRTRADVRAEFVGQGEQPGLPMLHLDATMPLDAVRHYLPRVEMLAEVNPPAPAMRLHLVQGGWGKTSLIRHETADEAENQRRGDENRRRDGLVRELADFAALNSGGNGAVLTYQAIEAKFQRPGVRTGHFGAIAGLDHLKDVRSLFVIGRPLPDAGNLHEMALALTGKPLANTASQVETRGASMADGTGAGVRVRGFADPDMEALRVAITDAAIVQAIGRCRGVTRTADDPVDVFLFADVVVPLPVTRVVRWEDVRPGVIERMASRGVALFSPTDAARGYPDLFKSAEAARKAIGRQGGFPGHSPIGISSIGSCPGNQPVEAFYKPHAAGQQRRRALVAPARLAALGDWLADRLGVAVVVETLQLAPVAAMRAALARWFGPAAARRCFIHTELPEEIVTVQAGLPPVLAYPNRATVDYPVDLLRLPRGRVVTRYGSQWELARPRARLTHLAVLQGVPQWQDDPAPALGSGIAAFLERPLPPCYGGIGAFLL